MSIMKKILEYFLEVLFIFWAVFCLRFFGLLVVVPLGVYWFALFLADILLRSKVDETLTVEDMPTLNPVPIPTKKARWYLKRVLIAGSQVRNWKLFEHWFYKIYDGAEELIIMVPKGFKFDGASIPRPFWAFISPIGTLLIPGLIHDFAYNYGFLLQIKIDKSGTIPKYWVEKYKEKNERQDWNNLFEDVCDQVNGSMLTHCIAGIALFVGSFGPWKEHDKDRKNHQGDPKKGIAEYKPPCLSDDDRRLIDEMLARFDAREKSSKRCG